MSESLNKLVVCGSALALGWYGYHRLINNPAQSIEPNSFGVSEDIASYVPIGVEELAALYKSNYQKRAGEDTMPTLTELIQGFTHRLNNDDPEITVSVAGDNPSSENQVVGTGSLADTACWQNPIAMVPSSIFEFGIVGNAYGKYTDSRHPGIDLRAPTGTPIFPAFTCGESEVSEVFQNEVPGIGPGYGVELKHTDPDGTVLFTRYYHCQEPPNVTPNQAVDQSTELCGVGMTGYSGGSPHLHLELFSRDPESPFNLSGISENEERLFIDPNELMSFGQ